MATKVEKKPKPFLKVGTHVTWTRRNGEIGKGRIAGSDDTPTGRWVSVNTAPKGKNAVLSRLRESQLRKV